MSTPLSIGAYPIERELGRGGMGIVYLGRDTRLDRLVAIKVLPEVFARDPERLGRFEREARLLASLNHPNIAGIYGIEEADGHRFLALEYVEGETLGDRLGRGPMPLEEALEVTHQIAGALETAHENGIVHRDLKPGNVKLTPAGVVKVLDFGLAKGPAGSAESSPDISQSPTLAYAGTGVGVILGTAAYMSPEQARGKTVDRRTDIWSFGALLYEILTGRQCFAGETVSDMIAKILQGEPDWNALGNRTPEKIKELLRRCLEKDAKKRLRDIGDARIELEEVLAARTSRSRIATAGESAPGGGVGVRSPVVAYAIAAIAVVIAAVVGLGPQMRKDRAPSMRLSITEPEGASLNGDPVDCALSPDGRAVVFVASDSSGTVRLWLRPLDELGARPIPGTDNAAKPFWSQDGRWIAFFADGKLKKVRPGGGAEVVCDAPNGRGGTWSARGTIVFAPAGEGPLLAVSASGGEPRQVTTLDSTRRETAHRFPSFLPDGKHFVYIVLPGGARGLQVKVGSLDHSGADRAVLEADGAPVYAEPGYLVFLRDRNLVAQRFDPGSLRVKGDPVALPDVPASSQSAGLRAATVSATGALAYMNGAVTHSRLAWFDRSGHVVETLPVPAAQYQIPVLSPDGRMVAVDRATSANESDIWLVSLDRGVATRFTYGPRQNSTGLWSPDGSRIAFESNRNGLYDIFLKSTSGALPETSLVQGGSQFKHPSSWSPDGRLLAFYQMDSGTGFDIWVVPTDGSGPARPYLQTPFHETFPIITPDGRWMTYVSDESGRPELYAQSFPTPGHKYQVTTTGCLVGGVLGSSREIITLGLDGQSLFATEILDSGTTFRTGTPRLLFRRPANVPGFDVTRDGQRFLLPVPEGRTAAASITVALNWQAGLASRARDGR